MHWSETRAIRSVNSLRLWHGNPRLRRIDDKRSQRSIIHEFVLRDREFLQLARGIAFDGFQYFDAIVTYRDEMGRFVVLEGNRRVAALKLLLNPSLAPPSRLHTYQRLSSRITPDDIAKIRVSVAPAIDDAVAFITRRHTGIPVKRWGRIMQCNWLVSRYTSAGGDAAAAAEACGQGTSESDVHKAVVASKLYEMAKRSPALSPAEREKVSDPHVFPLSTLERVFADFPSARERLGIDVKGADVLVTSERAAFMEAYGKIVRSIISDGDDKITSRNAASDSALVELLDEKRIETLPPATTYITVGLDGNTSELSTPQPEPPNRPHGSGSGGGGGGKPSTPRQRGLIPKYYTISSASQRVCAVFEELQRMSPTTLTNAAGVMLRVLLDLATSQYIHEKTLRNTFATQHQGDDRAARELKTRLTFVLNHTGLDESAKKVIRKLFQDSSNLMTLDTLNLFAHSPHAAPLMTKEKLNALWEGLFPLLKEIMDIDVGQA